MGTLKSGPSAGGQDGKIRVWFGSYDREPGCGGIYAAELDETAGQLSEPKRVAEVANPNFLAFSRDHQFLYAVCGAAEDSLAAFQTRPAFRELNRFSGLGKAVCHLALDPTEQNLVTVHYASSDFALFALNADHSLAGETQRQKLEGSGPNARRQSCPHPHSVWFWEGNRFYVPDLGTDKIRIWQLDSARHTFVPNDPPFAQAAAGSGPRHLCFLRGQRTAFSSDELSNTVTAWHVDESGALEPFETHSILPPGWKPATPDTTAEVACTPDERFLYVSNRGSDTLTSFRIAQDGSLTLLEIVSAHGQFPRHFAISPDGRFLLTANQKSGSVSLFAIQDSGRLTFLASQPLPVSPVCVLFD